jgi:hypothetical protein
MKNIVSAVLPDRNKLTAAPAEPVDVRPLPNYRFAAAELFGTRAHIIRKEMPR